MKIILSYITATIILLFLLALPIAGVVAYIRLDVYKRQAGEPARKAGRGSRGIAHRLIHDCHRTSAQRVPLPGLLYTSRCV